MSFNQSGQIVHGQQYNVGGRQFLDDLSWQTKGENGRLTFVKDSYEGEITSVNSEDRPNMTVHFYVWENMVPILQGYSTSHQRAMWIVSEYVKSL